jgi:hypothetical protein
VIWSRRGPVRLARSRFTVQGERLSPARCPSREFITGSAARILRRHPALSHRGSFPRTDQTMGTASV